MKLSEHFDLSEFTESETASRLGIDNTPGEDVVGRIRELVETILEPLRKAWGSGLGVSSGFRCSKLNDAVGGARTSAHLTGYAADIVPYNGKTDEFIRFATEFIKSNNIPFDQLIDEKNKRGSHWLHIGLKNIKWEQRGMTFKLLKDEA